MKFSLYALFILLAHMSTASFNFMSIGDWGCVPIGGQREHNELVVAKQFSSAAASLNARFVLNNGDSFYYCGVHNVSDPVFQSTFENVFTDQSTMVPWYSALGNHDYGYPGSAEAQLNYKSPNNDRWKMPGRYYYKRLVFPGEVSISLIVLDSAPCNKAYRSSDPSGWDPCGSVIPYCPGCTFHDNIMQQSCTDQLQWVKDTIGTVPKDDWIIVMSHNPGPELDVEDLLTPLQENGFDLFINGHVHLLAQYHVDGKGTYITTGAGCMVDVAEEKLTASPCAVRNPLHSCNVVWTKTVAGYTTHSFDSTFTTLTTKFYDSTGALLHATSTKKGSR